MSIGSVPGSWYSWKYPEEKGYVPALADLDPVRIDDLDSGESDSSDVDFEPGSETKSDVSDDEIERAEQADKDYFNIERAEQADKDYFNPSLYSRFKDKISDNFLTIGLAAICFVSALYFNGLPSEDQVKEVGFTEGISESMSAVRFALSYVEAYSGQNITDLFTQYLNNNYRRGVCL